MKRKTHKGSNRYLNANPENWHGMQGQAEVVGAPIYGPTKDRACCYSECPEPGTIHIVV